MLDRFDGVEAQVLGLSVDSVPCLQAWSDSLDGISFPLLSDFYPHGKYAQTYGVLRPEGISERAIFVIDKKGVIRFARVYDIDELPDNEELFRVLYELEPVLAEQMRLRDEEHVRLNTEPQDDVVLYCTPWCSDCRKAREFLQAKNIPSREVDISRDRAAAERVRLWTGGYETTPTFKVHGEVLIEFDEQRLSQALGIEP
jgi:glutaredoxin